MAKNIEVEEFDVDHPDPCPTCGEPAWVPSMDAYYLPICCTNPKCEFYR